MMSLLCVQQHYGQRGATLETQEGSSSRQMSLAELKTHCSSAWYLWEYHHRTGEIQLFCEVVRLLFMCDVME